MGSARPILLVEDDDIDARTVSRALKEVHITNPVARVIHGEEALAWLRNPESDRPGLILLDLNLPVMNGIEFLQAVKSDQHLRSIPVVVLTTSRLETDRLASFDLSVAGYIVKPVDYGKFVDAVRTINLYWTLSEAPP